MQERVNKDRYFLQNVIGISGVEFLYGLGLPVVVESTFLQIFLKKLGASNFAIGPILTLPFAVILPLVTGKFLDHYAALQAGAYRIVFLTAALLIFFTLLSILKTNFDVRSE